MSGLAEQDLGDVALAQPLLVVMVTDVLVLHVPLGHPATQPTVSLCARPMVSKSSRVSLTHAYKYESGTSRDWDTKGTGKSRDWDAKGTGTSRDWETKGTETSWDWDSKGTGTSWDWDTKGTGTQKGLGRLGTGTQKGLGRHGTGT